ncbi:unnamed protein product [Linum trigynum]|uniref:Reverse transcriptase zinc-binding domain-containing protein n=1 Tax=Linum trigynum TaxID=586398 RepID=A0AAV2EC88_9ROSI
MARFWWGATQNQRRIHWRAWRGLCASKFEGGLGFREFGYFNQALLAKVAWRILQEPNSLLARIYCAQYSFGSDFLSISAWGFASWGWRSILFGRDLLLQGLRWQVGAGDTIRAFSDPLIPSSPPTVPKLKSGSIPPPPIYVSALIDRGTKLWNLRALELFFSPDSIAAIQFPLSFRPVPDRVIWHYETSGDFTVKSAYHLAFSLLDSPVRKLGASLWIDQFGSGFGAGFFL